MCIAPGGGDWMWAGTGSQHMPPPPPLCIPRTARTDPAGDLSKLSDPARGRGPATRTAQQHGPRGINNGREVGATTARWPHRHRGRLRGAAGVPGSACACAACANRHLRSRQTQAQRAHRASAAVRWPRIRGGDCAFSAAEPPPEDEIAPVSMRRVEDARQKSQTCILIGCQ
jgi:hypothetical protein